MITNASDFNDDDIARHAEALFREYEQGLDGGGGLSDELPETPSGEALNWQ